MKNARFSTQDILDQLDECAREFTFPMLDNGYIYLADVRLTAYRDNARWAIVIEHLGANVRIGDHESINNCLCCFGNCLDRTPGTADLLIPTSDGEDGPTFEDEWWYVNPEVTTLRIRGNFVPIRLDPDFLAEKDILLEEPPRVNGAELLRSLLPEHREELLATEEELRRCIPADLPLLLRLEEWHHPDLASGELPSQSETFQQIAEALVSGDPSRYQPTRPPNTHWLYWPEGGTL